MSSKPLSDLYVEAFGRRGLRPARASYQIDRLWPLIYVSLDLLFLSVALLVAFQMRTQTNVMIEVFGLSHWQLSVNDPVKYVGFFLLFAALVVLFLHNFGLYKPRRTFSFEAICLRVLGCVTLSTVLIMSVFYIAHIAEDISRFVVFVTWGYAVVGLTCWRSIDYLAKRSRIRRGRMGRNVLIVGANGSGRLLARMIDRQPMLGLQLKGFVDDRVEGGGVLGRVDDLHYLTSKHFVEEIYITPPVTRETVAQVLAQTQDLMVDLKVVPDVYNLPVRANMNFLEGIPVFDLIHSTVSEVGILAKRALDIAGALVGLLIGVPLTLVVAAAIKLDDGGRVFYQAHRIGKKGKPFFCYKFRTMVRNADELKESLAHLNERQGPMFKIEDDPRITRVGRFLRKYSLDEWPQFLNVLKGEMSLVGPRPPSVDEVETYEKFRLEYFRRLDFKPGITSLWAIQSRQDPDFDRAFELDLDYIQHWSVWLDLKVLLLTVVTVFKGTGR